MKKLLCLPVFVVLLTIFSTSNVLGQKENDDSLSVVIPTTIEANLDMIVAPDVFEISKEETEISRSQIAALKQRKNIK